MEAIQDWASYLLSNTPTLLAYSSPYLRYVQSTLTYARLSIAYLIDRISTSPDLASIALLLVILFISLKILDILYNALLFWLRLAKQILFWGGLAVLGLWMYTRGPEGVLEDMQYWASVWSEEYGYWREREKMARMGNKGAWGGGGYKNGGGQRWF